jgi:hypothetical protein
MVGFLQIMIYLLCVYLVYKGVEIFQIALVAANSVSRRIGLAIGVIMISGSVVVGVCAIYLEESMAAQMSDNMNNIPKFR